MKARRKRSKKDRVSGSWALVFVPIIVGSAKIAGLKGPLETWKFCPTSILIWTMKNLRPNGACIAQWACFYLLLQGRGHLSRKKADGFDYQIIGALGTYGSVSVSSPWRVKSWARTTTGPKFIEPSIYRNSCATLTVSVRGRCRTRFAGEDSSFAIGPGTGASDLPPSGRMPGSSPVLSEPYRAE